MAHYLERYQSGECKQVWAELLSHGKSVRKEPLLSEARAVAHETMQRVRFNIERLIPRLIAVGYQFGYGWIQPFWREHLNAPYWKKVGQGSEYTSRLIEPAIPQRYTYSDRKAYHDLIKRAHQQPPLFLPPDDRDEEIAEYEHYIAHSPHASAETVAIWREMQQEVQERPSIAQLLDEAEHLCGVFPFSLHAFYEIVNGVNFVGYHPEWEKVLPWTSTRTVRSEHDYLSPFFQLDPLFVFPFDTWKDEQFRQSGAMAECYWSTSQDSLAKYVVDDVRDFYEIHLPCLGADAILEGHGIYFVDYLRNCFRWGGFPGWEHLPQRPEEDLAFITEGLLPI